MRKILCFLVLLMLSAVGVRAQMVQDASYRVVAHIKSDGTIQDASYRVIGHIQSNGLIQDASYRVVGHLERDAATLKPTGRCRTPLTASSAT